ncbi:MAG: DUF115 domain-containing protein [Treponema sp.]|nr:DUF115 domain-containing protein [Treponema sp.]
MLPDFLAANMEVLRRLYPRLAEELDKAADDLAADDLTAERAASGDPTLVCRGVYLHSKRDPRREAQRLAESAVANVGADASASNAAANDDNPALVLGFGLGYAAAALATSLTTARADIAAARPIIVVEKHPRILKKALELCDLRPLLQRSGVAFVLGGTGSGEGDDTAGVTAALSLFKSTPGVPPLVIHNRALTGLDEEWYAAVEERIKTWNSRTNVNRATQKRFGKRWVCNLARNLTAVRDIPGISLLQGILKGRGIPVFLAAAGPTLDASADILGEIAKRCLTVAVDTSLRFLVSRRAPPDFAVSVDPQYWNFRHLDRTPAPNTCLVTESAVYPPVLRHQFRMSFLYRSFFPLGQFVEEKVDPKGELAAGGSVATSAWDFIRHLGAESVWIAGLDLSFPELKTHFRGAAFEEKSHTESRRFSPAETWNFRALRDGQPFLAKRQGGGTVLTDKRLSLYAAWFENHFSRFPDVKNYSLHGEGLAIPGIETAAVRDILTLPERRREIDLLLEEVFAAIEADFCGEKAAARAAHYETARQALFSGLAKIKNLAEDAAESAETAARRGKQGRLDERTRERALKMLDTANKAITESAVKEIAGFLFPETAEWEAEIAALTADPFLRHLEFSARLYRSLAQASAYNLHALKFPS